MLWLLAGTLKPVAQGRRGSCCRHLMRTTLLGDRFHVKAPVCKALC